MTETDFDVIIIGGGPGGLACGLYLARAGLRAALFERMFTGGQAAITDRIENYPGVPATGGAELTMAMTEQAQGFGLEIRYDEISAAHLAETPKRVSTAAGDVTARAVVISTGAQPRPLGVPGEEELRGSGVSYCATCDGAFFRGREVAVIGGGDTAIEDASYLARFASGVTVVHRRGEFRAAAAGVERIRALPNVRLKMGCTCSAINGNGSVESITLCPVDGGAEEELAVQGVFIAVGASPVSDIARGQLDLDAGGYIAAGEDCRTSLPLVYAVGDVRTKQLRQVVTACADGANAAYSIQRDFERA